MAKIVAMSRMKKPGHGVPSGGFGDSHSAPRTLASSARGENWAAARKAALRLTAVLYFASPVRW